MILKKMFWLLTILMFEETSSVNETVAKNFSKNKTEILGIFFFLIFRWYIWKNRRQQVICIVFIVYLASFGGSSLRCFREVLEVFEQF